MELYIHLKFYVTLILILYDSVPKVPDQKFWRKSSRDRKFRRPKVQNFLSKFYNPQVLIVKMDGKKQIL